MVTTCCEKVHSAKLPYSYEYSAENIGQYVLLVLGTGELRGYALCLEWLSSEAESSRLRVFGCFEK